MIQGTDRIEDLHFFKEPKIYSTKEKILCAAIELFSVNGFYGVSIREITRKVGIKESSLYNHFQSKDEILDTIFVIFRREFAKTLPPVETIDLILEKSTLEEFFTRGFFNFKEFVDVPLFEKIWRIIYIEQYRHPMAKEIFLKDMIENTMRFLEVVLEKMLDKKMIKPFPPKTLATEYQYSAFAMLAEYLMLKFSDEDTTKIERKMQEHISFFIQLIKP